MQDTTEKLLFRPSVEAFRVDIHGKERSDIDTIGLAVDGAADRAAIMHAALSDIIEDVSSVTASDLQLRVLYGIKHELKALTAYLDDIATCIGEVPNESAQA